MRVLLDENLDWRLKSAFDSDFEVIPVIAHGWSGKKNGELLRLAEVEFDAMVTMDKSIEHQQNLTSIELGVVIIEAKSNRRQDVLPAMPKVNQVLRSIQPGEAIHVSANRCPGDSCVIPHEVGKKRGSNGVRVRTAFLFERSGHGL